MKPAEWLDLRVRRFLSGVVLCTLFWVGLAYPQDNSSPDQKTATPQAQSPANAPAHSTDQDKEVKITPQQAEELFHSIDEILEFDSKQSGLPIKHEVKRKLTSREEVLSFLTKHMNDEDAQRLRRSELVLKKFGLLPREFDLETFLVSLLKEEIAGYYDPKTKTVNLLDWVPIEEQEPVMAHELTHALQDQSIGLDKWMKKGDKDLAKIKRDITPEDIENDEVDDAREAVIEGQAQAMMFQYAIAPTGHSIVDSPGLVDAMEEETTSGTSGTEVFNQAPIFLKESLTFPYTYGMDFVIDLMRKKGKEEAFTAVLKNPPHTTRQIMEPEKYLADERIDPIRVPDFKRDFKDYDKFDIGAMGEFDVAVLAEQYVGKAMSKHIYPEWRGGYYYAAKSKHNAAADVSVTAPLGLLYVSRWSNADAAAEFAGIYESSLKERYRKIDEANAEPAATLHQADEPQVEKKKNATAQADGQQKTDSRKVAVKIRPLHGRHSWSTEEGTVVIEEQGDTVLVSESLEPATTATVEKEVFPAPAPQPQQH